MMIVGLALAAACAVGALVAAVSLVAMALPGRPEAWPVHLMRRAAVLAACAAASVYSLGFFAVLTSEHEEGNGANSTPAPACRDGFGADEIQNLSHHQSSYLPLRFGCVRDNGTTYPSEPAYAWMNLATVSFALTAVPLVAGAG